MPDFSLRITSAGTTSEVWVDTATVTAPSRLNPLVQYPHRYWRVPTATAQLILKATVAGFEGPADAALGGRLFTWSWVEQPSTAWSAPIPPTVGWTSITTFPANHFLGHEGHYTLLCSRTGGGAVGIPFEVV